MTEEIKRIIEELKDNIPIEECRSEGTSDSLTHYEEDKDSWQYKLLDYITNLQQENKKLKQCYCNRTDCGGRIKDSKKYDSLQQKYEKLQQENEKLKQNQSGFTLEDYARLLNNYQELHKEHKNCTRKHWQEKCGEHHAKELIYKSRCEKANKIITDFMCTEEYCNVDPVAIAENYMEIQKILNGSDENE